MKKYPEMGPISWVINIYETYVDYKQSVLRRNVFHSHKSGTGCQGQITLNTARKD